MDKGILNISWYCADNDGNFNFPFDEHHDEYVIDLATSKIYTAADDIGELDDPYFFSVYPVGSFMQELINEDDSFITDELSGKHLAEAIKSKQTEPKPIDGIISLHKWERPYFGEINLIYEVNSFLYAPQYPEEWDMTIDCVGELNLGNVGDNREKRIFKINVGDVPSEKIKELIHNLKCMLMTGCKLSDVELVEIHKDNIQRILNENPEQPFLNSTSEVVSKKEVHDIYLKLVEIHFNLQDPIPSTLEDATKDMDNVLKRLEKLLKLNKNETV